jgi:hypothetical protein
MTIEFDKSHFIHLYPAIRLALRALASNSPLTTFYPQKPVDNNVAL